MLLFDDVVKYLHERTRRRRGNVPAACSLAIALCEAAYRSKVITLGVPCRLVVWEKNRFAAIIRRAACLEEHQRCGPLYPLGDGP